jgi:protein phosphatase
MTIDIRGKTHIGRRALNEDRFVADAHWGIALVSDGMGGAAAGEVAAGIVIAGMVDLLDRGTALEEAVVRTHAEVRQAAEDGRGKAGMGATLVVARLDDYDFQLAWIGDSRAYLWNGELRQLTRDHSRVEALLASGGITPEEARLRKDKHVITRAMGLDRLRTGDVPSLHGTLCRGQRLLLCSDGLSDVLPGTEIATVMAAEASPIDTLDDLIGRALGAGGSDNITAVLVTADDDAPAPGTVSPPPAVSVARADGFSQYFPPGR